MTDPTTLSPAAQAVLDAVDEVYWDWCDMSPASASTITAAALRAAANAVEIDPYKIEHAEFWSALHDIATELENHQ